MRRGINASMTVSGMENGKFQPSEKLRRNIGGEQRLNRILFGLCQIGVLRRRIACTIRTNVHCVTHLFLSRFVGFHFYCSKLKHTWIVPIIQKISHLLPKSKRTHSHRNSWLPDCLTACSLCGLSNQTKTFCLAVLPLLPLPSFLLFSGFNKKFIILTDTKPAPENGSQKSIFRSRVFGLCVTSLRACQIFWFRLQTGEHKNRSILDLYFGQIFRD